MATLLFILIGFLLPLAALVAVFRDVESKENRIIWTAIILLVPILGAFIYLAFTWIRVFSKPSTYNRQ